MKAEIRETLGKAAYEATHTETKKWDEQDEEIREGYRLIAQAVVPALGELMIPQLQYMAMVLTDRPVEITLGEVTAAWPKEEK
jgi:hypothetical protein